METPILLLIIAAMWPLASLLAWTGQFVLAICSLYLLVLAAASQWRLAPIVPIPLHGRDPFPEGSFLSGRHPLPLVPTLDLATGSWRGPGPTEYPLLVVLIPAHNEAATLPRTLASLALLNYPAARWQLIVIADNCDDETAVEARRCGHALGLPIRVWERQDAFSRGKGHALHWALERLTTDEPDAYDGWVIFDADTDVDADCLMAFARGLQAGYHAMQGCYGIRDAATTSRRRMAYLSAGIYHQMRSHGRDVLGLSAGLYGNGMAFHWGIAREIGWQAMSIVEDIEYQAILALHGIRVRYVAGAKLWAEAPRTLRDSRSQRQRWEHGRAALNRFYVPPLVRAAVTSRSVMPLALALDVAMPAYVWLWLWGLASVLFPMAQLGSWPLWGTTMGALGLFLVLGLRYLRGPAWLIPTLLWAPVFACWVLLLRLRPAPTNRWVRTPRDGIVGDGPAP